MAILKYLYFILTVVASIFFIFAIIENTWMAIGFSLFAVVSTFLFYFKVKALNNRDDFKRRMAERKKHLGI